MRKKSLIIASLFLVSATSAIAAQVGDSIVGVELGGMYTNTSGSSSNSNNTIYEAIKVGHYFTYGRAGMAVGHGNSHNGLETNYLGGLYDYMFYNDTKFTPFVGAVLAYSKSTIKDPNFTVNATGFSYGPEAGLTYEINREFDLEIGARYLASNISGNDAQTIVDIDNITQYYVGLNYAFGKAAQKTIPATLQTIPKEIFYDDDHDGIENSLDKCAYTPDNTEVDANGCMINRDDDQDGIPNNLDKCPQTSLGLNVDKNGCEIKYDDDNDGVLNKNDMCPYTPYGERVNKDGCIEAKNLHINFGRDSYIVQRESMRAIDNYASYLIEHPNYSVNIIGYTDSKSSISHNKKLSLSRARAVVKELIARGVNPNQLYAYGRGEANPIADNSTSEGRAANRRIEAELYKN